MTCHEYYLAAGAFLLELARDTGNGATGAGAADNHVHVTVTCVQYFLGGAVIVCHRVSRVRVL